ncbi:hypothetical protein QTO34_004732 [Cnephaeus nilssonii]|uniref:Uncharacterized protein n=1 Tax=Cnephaeus nilssonii TaxID=3371016 RepID=A0AA40HPW2_CNENI|nr:hypothetical protein QTO34_004732 [Eptesicus nilssonii]
MIKFVITMKSNLGKNKWLKLDEMIFLANPITHNCPSLPARSPTNALPCHNLPPPPELAFSMSHRATGPSGLTTWSGHRAPPLLCTRPSCDGHLVTTSGKRYLHVIHSEVRPCGLESSLPSTGGRRQPGPNTFLTVRGASVTVPSGLSRASPPSRCRWCW